MILSTGTKCSEEVDMAYTLNQGYHAEHNFDRLQRGLLVGLPAIALILSFGAIWHHQTADNPASVNPKTIPIVSTLSNSKDSSGSNGQSNRSAGESGTSGVSGAANTSASSLGSTGTTGGSSGTTSTIGGMGGGPATGSGGILPINESLYIPPLDAQAGGKSLVNTSGTTVNLN
jgi:hypothetical protein